jgi:hypothetical protein
MAQSTPVSTKRSNHNGGLDLDEIDLESLRLVFGSTSPEDLNNRKAHELRELWLQKTATTTQEASTGAAVASPLSKTKSNNAARMPRFLLDPKNKDHIPPHAVALQLLLGRKGRGRDITTGDGLYQRVARHESGEHSAQNGSGLHHHHQQQQQHPSSHQQRNAIDPRNNNNSNNNNNNNNTMVFGTIFQSALLLVAILSLTCQFVLEVLGGAGAIWGCAELVRLRKGGPVDPSWQFFTWVAMGVGICCLVRFLLVHPFFCSATDPTFAEKHKLFRLGRQSKRFGLVLEMAKLVARDPVLFLHPIKGHVFSSCCGCYCVFVGSRWSTSIDDPNGNIIPNADGDPNADINADGGDWNAISSGNGQQHRSSPRSLGKPSPQRSTWDLSDDENEIEIENDVEFVNA